MRPKFFSAILIYSKDVERLGSFYRDVIGLPMEEEKHGPEPMHFGCELGDLHFAIHPKPDSITPGPVVIAFEVFDIEEHMREMIKHNVNIVSQITDHGFAKIAAIHDPDGNRIEFSQLGKGWIEHLRARRQEGHDIVSQWDKLKL
jgi:predicted enzyme related to lactoylglutathione lyase